MILNSIDSLEGMSAAEKKAALKHAKKVLNVRGRILEWLHEQGTEPGHTLEEYREKLDSRDNNEMECPTCDGTGVVKPPKPRKVGCIHPSSSAECVLRLYHDVVGDLRPRPSFQPGLMITFAIGHSIHDYLQKALLDKIGAHRFDPEAGIKMGIVSGNTDGIMEIDGVRAILEIKTDGPSSFTSRRSPDKKHRLQAGGLYATALDAPVIVYLYVEKVFPHTIKEYVELYSPDLFSKWLREKHNPVLKGLETGQEPIADATRSECSSCPYNYEGGCAQVLGHTSIKTFRR